MPNNLPPTLPAGSWARFKDENDSPCYDLYHLPSPVHLLTPEGIEAIRELQSLAHGWKYLGECNKWSGQVRSIEQSCSRVDAAFAHVIDKPAEDVKPKTCREYLDFAREGSSVNAPVQYQDKIVTVLCDRLDAQQKVIEELLKERGETV